MARDMPADIAGIAPGVVPTGDGIDVAVYAPDAEAVAISLFDARDQEYARLRLPARTGGMHHGHVAGVAAGTRYGLRAFGPWDPARGLRFNGAKLLMDPWATAIDRPFRLDPALFDRDGPHAEDTAPLMPKAIVRRPPVLLGRNGPDFDWDRQVIYELHVRGFTMMHPEIPPALRGTYAGLAHPAAIAHLTRLGISTVEIMPSAAWVDERHLPGLGLSNYWGYNPIAFMAPDPRLAPGGWAEVRDAVRALHAAGIGVILDVVLNHSGESDELGPTLSLRGLDNAGYYRLAADPALYVNDAGCGNVLALDRPMPLRLAMDTLRAWALYGGFDGFRLDLAVTLGRRADGFDPAAPLLAAIEQDPVLSRRVFIAEPWDIGPGGYQLGRFPARWAEWNDRFRDSTRRFWRGDAGMLGEFTTRFAGSADVFRGRALTRSINFITAHDGFTLADLVSYAKKHNAANGEANRDGTDDNLSWNNGVEGASDDPAVLTARARDARALLASLLLARGTPMLAMGDELGRTQNGNNNAYAQDNESAWVDWARADTALCGFVADCVRLRRELAPLFDGRTLSGQPAAEDVPADVAWLTPDGRPMAPSDWERPDNRTLLAVLYGGGVRAALVFHAGPEAVPVTLPAARAGFAWRLVLASDGAGPADHPDAAGTPARTPAETPAEMIVAGRSVAVFMEQAVPPAAGVPVARTGASDEAVNRLAELAGIQPVWWDVDGGHHAVDVATRRALLAAMRLPATTESDVRDGIARLTRPRPLPPVLTARAEAAIPVPLAPSLGASPPAWVALLREDGSQERFPVRDGALVLPPQPVGRHRLLIEDRSEHICHLTVAPARCFVPPALADGGRRFGIAAHLYSLRSSGDQGIGDFATLAQFGAMAARQGAAMVGLNPLHALFPHDRTRCSPYNPSDRRFLDPIYIDVSGFPGGSALPSPPGSVDVDYAAVWARKRAVLWDARQPPADVPDGLRRFATFEAIAAVRGSSAWQDWPVELRHPDAPGVAAFARAQAELVAFHAFLQTVAETQLEAAAAAVRRDGLTLGLYRDLAVGTSPDGAEAWAGQDSLMSGVSIGAPPDPFSADGQVWCLPPPDPWAMRREGYAGFAELLRANMRHAGALRIDHVMGLRRLFVVPEGASATEGAYVTYPMEDLLAQVALESQRARCLVVGEDLGTVPEGMAEALGAANILSYRVLWFERENGGFKPPPAWRRQAAACVSTHDLPTLAGWWQGADITEKRALGMAVGAEAEADRLAEKANLIALLRTEGLLDTPIDPAGPMPAAFAAAVHGFVAATPSLLALAQADDLAGETIAVNLPGTHLERPNWRRRLAPDVETLADAPLARAILAAMRGRSEADESESDGGEGVGGEGVGGEGQEAPPDGVSGGTRKAAAG